MIALSIVLQCEDSVDAAAASTWNNTTCNSSMLSFPFTSMLLRSGLTAECEVDDNAQKILEEHVLRVWDRSNGPTPGGGFSPGLRTPNQHRASANARCAATNASGSVGGQLARGPSMVTTSSKLSSSHRSRGEDFVNSSHHEDRQPASVAANRHSHRHQLQTVSASAIAIKDSSSSRDSAVMQRQFRSHAANIGCSNSGGAEQTELAKRSGVRRGGQDSLVVSNSGRSTLQDLQTAHVPEVASER